MNSLVKRFGNLGWIHVDCRRCGIRWSTARCHNHAKANIECRMCSTSWPYYPTEAEALAALNQPTPAPLTGHNPTAIIVDDPHAEAPSQPKPAIDWFAINKEFSQ